MNWKTDSARSTNEPGWLSDRIRLMMNARTQIRDFVVQNFLFGQSDGLTDEASFLDQGIIDSTGVLELVAFLEKSFGIKVRDEELVPDNLDSINAVATYLERKLVEAGSHPGNG